MDTRGYFLLFGSSGWVERRMVYRIAIEILNADEFSPIIARGYKLSRFGPVAFILNGATPRQVNTILDKVVPTMSLNIPGVTYVAINAADRVAFTLASSDLIVSCSESLHNLALREQQSRGRPRILSCAGPSHFIDNLAIPTESYR